MPDQGRQAVYITDGWEVDLACRELRGREGVVPLGSRAFEILVVLLRATGEVVTKDELMARVWPGAIVEENTLWVHISAVRKALGPDRDLLKTTSGRGYRLIGNWEKRLDEPKSEPPAPAPEPAQARSHAVRLPAAGSALIGRAEAMQRLRDLLSAYRIVTLTGPGGIGKTVLALAAARSLSPFAGDRCLVELASLSDPGLVPWAVANALGVQLGGGAISAEAVARSVGERCLLLVLDNCEHVIDAAAELAETLLRRCPKISILATSREVLRIEGEHVFRVPPLDVPSAGDADRGSVLERSAVQLFLAKVEALDAAFSLDDANTALIGLLCRHLDGIPLAIELAASRAVTLGLSRVAAGLDDRFAMLTGGRRTALPRHQTLRATLDWSYDLLPGLEQCLLRRSAIFAGAFTLEAAASLMGEAFGFAGIAEPVANLVAKSLLVLDSAAPVSRWRLLETTRAYGLTKLTDEEHAEASRRHAHYFLRLYEQCEADWGERPMADWLVVYGRQIDNLRVALDWAFSPKGDIGLGVALTIAAAPLWFQLSLAEESRQCFDRALSVFGEQMNDPRQRMQLLALRACVISNGTIEDGRATFHTVLELADQLGDNDHRAVALWALRSLHSILGDNQVQRDYAERFREVAEATGDAQYLAISDQTFAQISFNAGDIAAARACLTSQAARGPVHIRRAKQIRRHMASFVDDGSIRTLALFLQGFADQARLNEQGNYARALASGHAVQIMNLLRQSACFTAIYSGDLAQSEIYVGKLLELSITQEFGISAAMGRCFEGMLLNLKGDPAAGLARLREGIDRLRATGFLPFFPRLLSNFAERLGEAGEIEPGLTAIAEAIEIANRFRQDWYQAELLRVRARLDLLAGNVEEAERGFERGLDLARRQGALAWELRTVLDLAALRRSQARSAEGLELLLAVYRRFTEGFGTSDLRSAEVMLESLTSVASIIQ